MKIQLGLKRPILCAAATILAISAAHADTPAGKATLSGYMATSDIVTGALLASHDYDALIGRLAPHGAAFNDDEVAASTNLCVAYAATHQLGEARAACDEAVKVAKADESGITLADHKMHDQALALALANQSVVARMGQ